MAGSWKHWASVLPLPYPKWKLFKLPKAGNMKAGKVENKHRKHLQKGHLSSPHHPAECLSGMLPCAQPRKPGVVAHTCNLSIWELETWRSEDQKVTLGYTVYKSTKPSWANVLLSQNNNHLLLRLCEAVVGMIYKYFCEDSIPRMGSSLVDEHLWQTSSNSYSGCRDSRQSQVQARLGNLVRCLK